MDILTSMSLIVMKLYEKYVNQLNYSFLFIIYTEIHEMMKCATFTLCIGLQMTMNNNYMIQIIKFVMWVMDRIFMRIFKNFVSLHNCMVLFVII